MNNFIVMVLCSLCAVSSSYALSIGPVISGKIGTASEQKEWGGVTSNKHDYEPTRESIGLAVNSSVDTDSIFSNHLEVLYTMLQAKEGMNKYRLRGITTINDFCFGIVRKPDFRIWIGPELVVEHLSGPRTRDGESDYAYHTSIGIGGAVGLNINTSFGVLFFKGNYDVSGALMANNRTWSEKYGGLTVGLVFPM